MRCMRMSNIEIKMDFVKEAKKYASKVVIKANGKSAEATRLMAIMGMGVKCGQTVEVEVSGDDEDTAFEGMKAFFEENL